MSLIKYYLDKYKIYIISLLVWCTNIGYAKVRLQHLIDENPAIASEVNQFIIGYFLAVFIPTILLIILQFSGRVRESNWVIKGDLNNPFVVAGNSVIIVTLTLFIWWLWLSNGAETLAKFREAFASFPDNPMLIRFYLTACVLVGFVSIIVARLRQIGSN